MRRLSTRERAPFDGERPSHFVHPGVLGLQRRTWTNECELRRTRCCYPLRFYKILRLSTYSPGGNLVGKTYTCLGNTMILLRKLIEFESSPGHQIFLIS